MLYLVYKLYRPMIELVVYRYRMLVKSQLNWEFLVGRNIKKSSLNQSGREYDEFSYTKLWYSYFLEFFTALRKSSWILILKLAVKLTVPCINETVRMTTVSWKMINISCNVSCSRTLDFTPIQMHRCKKTVF